jgi:hypothetical protein
MKKPKKWVKFTYDYRYPKDWIAISKKSRELCPICCLCISNQSTEVHHVRYAVKGKLLLENVILGVDIFPVCNDCHTILHTRSNYRTFKDDSHLNHNFGDILFQLEIGFKIASSKPKPRLKSF